jgi:hypothetical protein
MWGILNDFEGLKTFSNKNYDASWRHFQKNGGINKKSEASSKLTRLFKIISDKWRFFS